MGIFPYLRPASAGDAYKLRLDGRGRDVDSRIVRPNGALHFVTHEAQSNGPIYNNYDYTEKVLKDRLGYNFLIFGYDWRRTLEDGVHWLDYVVKNIKQRLETDYAKPLGDLVLLGHSFGGLLGKTYLNDRLAAGKIAFLDSTLSHFISVGTPFYGTIRQFDNIYSGVGLLNRLYSPKVIAEIAASFPGPYAGSFVDPIHFYRWKEVLGDVEYPLLDERGRKPLYPLEKGHYRRYPGYVPKAYLDGAAKTRIGLQNDLPNSVLDRTFHIRSGLQPMPGGYRWQDINGSRFVPDGNNSPVQASNESEPVPADGAVYAWSACLGQTVSIYGNSRIHDCRTAKVEHEELMESDEVLKVISTIIEHNRLTPSKSEIAAKAFISEDSPDLIYADSILETDYPKLLTRGVDNGVQQRLQRRLSQDIRFL